MVWTEGQNILEFLHALDVLKNATSKCKLRLLNNLISLGNIRPLSLVFWSYREKITYVMYYNHGGFPWQRTEDQAFILYCTYQGLSQVLRTWGVGGVGVALQNLMWGLKSIQWGSMGGALNAVEKTLQACKFSKNELLHTYFWRILARF